MGLSGMILKDKSDFNFDKLMNEVKICAEYAGAIYSEGLEFEVDEYGTYVYSTIVLKDRANNENEFIIYLYNDIGDMVDGRYSFIDVKKNLQQCMNIEDFRSCKMLLDFIYKYISLNVNDIFFNEQEWYYTLEDLEQMTSLANYDIEWCYKQPSEKSES